MTILLKDAPCGSYPSDLFFPTSELTGPGARQVTAAKTICDTCPLRADCLEEKLAEEGNAEPRRRFGIWGGTTPAERYAIYRDRKAATAQLATSAA